MGLVQLFIFAENYRAGRWWMDQLQLQTARNVCVVSCNNDMHKMQGIENPICIMLPGWEKHFKIPGMVLNYISSRRGVALRPYQ